VERQCVVNTTGAFLYCTNAALNLRYVFVVGHGVECNLHVGHVGAQRFKLAIHKHMGNVEPTSHVDAFHLFDGGKDCFVLLILERLGCAKLDVSRESHEKWQLVDKQDVAAQGQLSTVRHDCGRDVGQSSVNSNGATAHSLAFEGPITPGPKIASAMEMSQRVMGQFGNSLFSIILRNVRLLEWPIIFCVLRTIVKHGSSHDL
jgi:hypothetical protein